MDLKNPVWPDSLSVPAGQSHDDHRSCPSLRRIHDGVFVSKDFTVMTFFTGRLWILKIQGVTIGRFASLPEAMDFIEAWIVSD